jgi:hypothetical protein
MQDSASSHPLPSVMLYRVCYRCKATGEVGKASDVDTLEDAQKVVKAFNARYQKDFVYFAKPVKLDSLEPQQLDKLMMEGKLSPNLLGSSPELCSSR